jgi:hypothetical protein
MLELGSGDGSGICTFAVVDAAVALAVLVRYVNASRFDAEIEPATKRPVINAISFLDRFDMGCLAMMDVTSYPSLDDPLWKHKMSDETGSANTSVTVPGTGTAIELGDLKASIAAELAAELCGPEDIRKRYGLTKGQWDTMRTNPMFRGMVRDALQTFRGPLAAGQRITKKAEIALEDALPELYLMAKDTSTPVASRIDAIQTLADLAGRSAKAVPNAAPAQQGFTLNIQFGNDQKVTIDGKANDPE